MAVGRQEEACRVEVVDNVEPVVCIVVPVEVIVASLQKINSENEWGIKTKLNEGLNNHLVRLQGQPKEVDVRLCDNGTC